MSWVLRDPRGIRYGCDTPADGRVAQHLPGRPGRRPGAGAGGCFCPDLGLLPVNGAVRRRVRPDTRAGTRRARPVSRRTGFQAGPGGIPGVSPGRPASAAPPDHVLPQGCGSSGVSSVSIAPSSTLERVNCAIGTLARGLALRGWSLLAASGCLASVLSRFAFPLWRIHHQADITIFYYRFPVRD